MKTLRLTLLAVLVAGCHFDKLLNDGGGGAGPPRGAITRLAFTTEPGGTTTGQAITPAVQVTVRDSNGDPVPTFADSISIALGSNAAGGTLSGTRTVAGANGVAAFTNLSIDRAGSYTLRATASGTGSATSSAFDVTAPPGATRLIFATQPSNTAPGATISPPVQVAAADDQGNIVTSFSGTISIAIDHDGSLLGNATLAGTTNDAPTVNGVATFSNLSIDQISVSYYTLGARNAQLNTVVSAHFTVP